MFEQSLLTSPAGTRKTATFAASLTAQILVAGVLVVAPLFYHEMLPALRVPDIVPVVSWPKNDVEAQSTKTNVGMRQRRIGSSRADLR